MFNWIELAAVMIARSTAALPADDLPTDDETRLGLRLRAFRQQRGLSLKQLSERSDLSVGMLSQIERGMATPSLRALGRLRDVYGVPLARFFDDQATPDATGDDVVQRAGQCRRVEFAQQRIAKELVSPPSAGALEMMVIVMEPGGGSGAEPYSHEGEECGHVLEGRFDLWVGDRTWRLERGDSFQFASHNLHRFHNPGPGTARVLWTVTPPFYGRKV
ncbi:cupin domain-containing protein [Allostella humosa]|uniref:cupin domain-containing protein n=1 Tax=Stella humosa TaxID=94 RepID=UPI00114FD132|nr:cupin domain-containing protein [Stella humosa]